MRNRKWSLFSALGLLLLVSSACNFSVSTAHLNGLKVGKDKAMTQETAAFATTDTIYAAAEVGNAPGKTKVKGRLIIEDVAGQQAGPIPGLETTVDLESSGTASFNFSPPTAGWPAGKYKMEVLMLNEDGVQKDQKSASFTIS